MELQAALKYVKKFVKMSAIDNQAHIDLTQAPASERVELERALAALKLYIKRGDTTQEAVNSELGLKS